jgi:hypothetical protein
MIAHVVLYRFPDSMDVTEREQFRADLTTAARRTGVVDRFTAGEHVSLPADEHAPDALFSLAARWEFTDLEALRVFSQHPVMTELVDAWVRGRGIDVAFANTADEQEVVW